MQEILKQPARTVVKHLKSGDLSPLECLNALEKRIADVNPATNALVTLCFDRARQRARALMKKPRAARGLLGGLPVPIKDLVDVEGVRSTQGSRIFANTIAQESDILVRHLEGEGGVVYAMSNTPEFGAGAQTFNDVFGATRNPWDTRLTPAGSSGGAAVALATGMAWLAHGSDFGGSLRNPASYCGIVGLRPTPGRVAISVYNKIDGTLGIDGPMARDVKDLALLLDAMVGYEPGDPVSLPREAPAYRSLRARKPKRIAVSRDLGVTPVDPEVADMVMAAAHKFEQAGAIVEEAHPALPDLYNCFHVLRAQGFATSMQGLLAKHRELLKPEVIWNIEKGLKLTGAEVGQAEAQRGAIFRSMNGFLAGYDALICPATIVPPFPVEERWVKSCNGVAFETYVDWLLIVAAATMAMCPAMSIPCGFTRTQFPIGLQIIGANRADHRLVETALWMEEVLDMGRLTPIDPIVRH